MLSIGVSLSRDPGGVAPLGGRGCYIRLYKSHKFTYASRCDVRGSGVRNTCFKVLA